MKKKQIRLLALVTAAFWALSAPALAAVGWDSADVLVSANIFADGGFDRALGTVFDNGAVDTVTFAETEHGNTLYTPGGYFSVRDAISGALFNLVRSDTGLLVEFDYYTASATAVLRCELRNTATSGELSLAGQNPFWEGFAYTDAAIVPETWHHFQAVMDTKALRAYYASQGTLNTNPTHAFILISGNGQNLFIDNISIKNADDDGLIVPMQTARYEYGETFAPDGTVQSPFGETEGVYKGLVDASESGKMTAAVTLGGYSFNEGLYKMSFWFMEDENNADQMTRMWRPIIGTANNATVIKSTQDGWMYYSGPANDVPKGVWKYVEMEFEVTASNSHKALLSPGSVIRLWWQCAASESYSGKMISGEYYIYLSGLKFFKYPAASTVLNESFPDDNAGIVANGARAEFDFSMYIDASSIKPENILINGAAQNGDLVDISVEGTKISIAKKGGFAPGMDYAVSLEGVRDIFGRSAAEGPFTKAFKTMNYTETQFLGYYNARGEITNASGASAMRFKVTNLSGERLDFLAAVIFYQGNKIERISFSQKQSGIEHGRDVTVDVPVEETGGSKIKVNIWSNAGNEIRPLGETLNIDRE